VPNGLVQIKETSLNLKFNPYNIQYTNQTCKDFTQASKIHSELLFKHYSLCYRGTVEHYSSYSDTRGVTHGGSTVGHDYTAGSPSGAQCHTGYGGGYSGHHECSSYYPLMVTPSLASELEPSPLLGTPTGMLLSSGMLVKGLTSLRARWKGSDNSSDGWMTLHTCKRRCKPPLTHRPA
jgi:hypothetical protein